jgi:hypothetical protein
MKFINSKNNTIDCLSKVLNYVTDSDKTSQDLCGGFGCSVKYPLNDMNTVKRTYRKTDGRQYLHYITSFDPIDRIAPHEAVKVIREITSYFGKYQSFFAVHTNSEHLHAHVVMNSISEEGVRFRQWKPQLNKFKDHISQNVCNKYGIAPIHWTKGKTSVDDVNLLEIQESEFLIYKNNGRGIITMSNSYDPYDPSDSCDPSDYYDPSDSCDPSDPFGPCYIGNDKNNCKLCEPSILDNVPELNNRLHIQIGDKFKIAAPSKDDAIQIYNELTKGSQNNQPLAPTNLINQLHRFNSPFDLQIGNEVEIVVFGSRYENNQ